MGSPGGKKHQEKKGLRGKKGGRWGASGPADSPLPAKAFVWRGKEGRGNAAAPGGWDHGVRELWGARGPLGHVSSSPSVKLRGTGTRWRPHSQWQS